MRKVFARFLTVLLVLLVAAPTAEGRRRRGRGSWGKLQVNSMTEGATVFVDGREVGSIPLSKPIRLKASKHTLKITKQGYTEYLDVFTIRRGKTTVLEIDLLPYAGVVVIEANVPQARVFIDGKFVGTTPVEREVLIGKRSVKVSKAGYYDFIGHLKTIAGKNKRLVVKLKPMPVGTTPYRPPPPPPPKWYEKWYVWAGAAAAVAAVTVAIVVPVTIANQDPVGDFCGSADFCWQGK